MLLSTRRQLHKSVAECYERIDADRVNEIGRHFLEAREHARALPCLVEAGDRAAHSYSTPEAIGYYEQALTIVGTEKDGALARRAYEGLAGALTLSNDMQRSVETYEEMLRFAQEDEDVPMQVSALNKMALVLGTRMGEFPKGVQLLEDSEALARRYKDIPGLAELHMFQCNFCMATADFDGAVDHLSEAVQIGRELDMIGPRLFGLTHVANFRTYMAQFEDAWQTAQEGRRLAEQVGHLQFYAELLTFSIGLYHLRNGDLEAAHRSAEEGVNIAAQIGATSSVSAGCYLLGHVSWLRGEYEAAIEHYERALEAARAAESPWYEAVILCALGTASLDMNHQFEGELPSFHVEAIKVMETPGGLITGATSWAELGLCAVRIGNLDRATEFLQKGLTQPTAPMYLEKPRLLVGSALVALARDNTGQAAKYVEDAREFVEERGMRNYYPLIALAEGSVRTAQGESDAALKGFARAEALAEEMQMRPVVWQARAGAAEVLSAIGRPEEAEAKRSDAKASIGEIAELFQDGDLGDKFLVSATAKLG